MKILIIEDDKIIAGEIKKQLEIWNYEVQAVNDFKRVIETFDEYMPQLVLLDISLPFYNGYYWCTQIRKKSKVPIIFISSSSENMNIVMAVNMGGDDFVPKPFDMEVLIAKITAILRRTYDFSSGNGMIEVNGVQLDTADCSLIYNKEKSELTKNEYRILQVLMENKNHVISRDILMTKLWESDSYVDDNTLTVNITRLRKHLEDIGLGDFIKTKKGLGYIISDTKG